eukprot:gene1581-16033_t
MENVAKRLRIYKNLPVVICEWHQHVLPHIHRGIASRHLPAHCIKMIHFDAHPDLTFPLTKSADDCFEKSILYDELEIADWILPLFYEGHMDKVDLKDEYFIEELLYSRAADISDANDVSIQVKTLCCGTKCDKLSQNKEEVCDSQLCESAKRLKEDFRCKDVEDLIVGKSESFILDIDLDFFSTYNPFKLQHSKDDFARLAEIYQFEAPNSLSEEDIGEAMKNRQYQLEKLQNTIKYFIQDKLKELTKPTEFLNLIDQEKRVDVSEIDSEYYSLLLKLHKNANGTGTEFDLELIHFAGMSSELPHHRSTNDEINNSLEDVELFLRCLEKPIFVTIARSAEDEYTPKDQVDYIQQRVIQLLKKLYGDISIVKDYENINENT